MFPMDHHRFFEVIGDKLNLEVIPSSGDLIGIENSKSSYYSHGVTDSFRLINPRLEVLDTIYFSNRENIYLFQIMPTNVPTIGVLRLIKIEKLTPFQFSKSTSEFRAKHIRKLKEAIA